jgi:hypothetical protein
MRHFFVLDLDLDLGTLALSESSHAGSVTLPTS